MFFEQLLLVFATPLACCHLLLQNYRQLVKLNGCLLNISPLRRFIWHAQKLGLLTKSSGDMYVLVLYLLHSKRLNWWIFLWIRHAIHEIIQICSIWAPKLLTILPLIHYERLCMLEPACLLRLVVVCTCLGVAALRARAMKATLCFLRQVLAKRSTLSVLWGGSRIRRPTYSRLSLLL